MIKILYNLSFTSTNAIANILYATPSFVLTAHSNKTALEKEINNCCL